MALHQLLPPGPDRFPTGPALFRPHHRPGEAELFVLALPEQPDPWIETLAATASRVRRERADRFRDRWDALRCLAAEALLWHAAAELHGLDPRQLAVGTGPHGKPHFLDHPGLHFNLAHSGRWVLCAFDQRPVGVDVEQETALRPGMPEAVLTSAEQADLAGVPEEQRQAAFFRLWTFKESLLKAAGTGLGADPRSFALDRRGQPGRGAPPAPAGCRWRLVPVTLPPGAQAALCIAR